MPQDLGRDVPLHSTLRVTKAEAADLAKGTWRISALATAEDGDTEFVSPAASVEVTG